MLPGFRVDDAVPKATVLPVDEEYRLAAAAMDRLDAAARSRLGGVDAPRVVERESLPAADDFYADHVLPGQPGVFRGAARHWKAVEKWTLEYLADKVGEHDVQVNRVPQPGDVDGPLGNYLVFPQRETMRMRDFADLVRNAAPGDEDVYYLSEANDNFRTRFASLHDDIEMVMPCTEGTPMVLESLNMWMGTSNCRAPVHSDTYNNLYVVVRGTKTFRLYHPLDAAFMYTTMWQTADFVRDDAGWRVEPRPRGETQPWPAVDVDSPDFERHERFARARAVDVTLHAGDVLFVPLQWYHRVTQTPDDDNKAIAVNFWYESDRSQERTVLLHFIRNEYLKHLGETFDLDGKEAGRRAAANAQRAEERRRAAEERKALDDAPSELTEENVRAHGGDDEEEGDCDYASDTTIASIEYRGYQWVWETVHAGGEF